MFTLSTKFVKYAVSQLQKLNSFLVKGKLANKENAQASTPMPLVSIFVTVHKCCQYKF